MPGRPKNLSSLSKMVLFCKIWLLLHLFIKAGPLKQKVVSRYFCLMAVLVRINQMSKFLHSRLYKGEFEFESNILSFC